MSEQEKKWHRIYDLLNTEISQKNFSKISGVSSSDLNPLDYATWSVLENKKNVTSHPNIGLLKTAIVEEWNKMSEEFNLNACKLFQRYVDTITEKKWRPYWVNLQFVSIILFCCLFCEIKIDIFLVMPRTFLQLLLKSLKSNLRKKIVHADLKQVFLIL